MIGERKSITFSILYLKIDSLLEVLTTQIVFDFLRFDN